MAKSKVSSKANGGPLTQYSPTTHITFDDLAEVKGVSVGDEVRILLTGKVTSITLGDSYGDSAAQTSSICLKDFEAEIVEASIDLEALLEDEDD